MKTSKKPKTRSGERLRSRRKPAIETSRDVAAADHAMDLGLEAQGVKDKSRDPKPTTKPPPGYKWEWDEHDDTWCMVEKPPAR